jgi:pimeloyl-ACP methyl ester carboxylesterase
MIAEHHRGGSGPSLLLIHGFTATWRTWGPVIGMLEQQFDVFAPTLPGHTGGPDVDESNLPAAFADGLEAMLDELGWPDPHVAGFSLGGQLALELGIRGRARSVTAIAPGGAHGETLERVIARTGRMFRRNRMSAQRFDRLNARLSGSAAFRRATLRDMMVDGSRVPAEESLAMARAFAATPVFQAFLHPDLDRGLRNLDRITVPVTVAWGDGDRVLPQAKHESFFREQLPPHATFRTLKNAGHVPFWDAPERVADVIAQTALAADRQREGVPA